jgi:8-amino-7-oxononanoate synthase
MSSWLGNRLQDLRERSLYRHLRLIDSAQGPIVQLNDRSVVNFSSNDYLGLANAPELREVARAAIEKWGVGAGASRLVCGTQVPHALLERTLAEWKETEAALSFSSGYAAATGVIPALLTKDDIAIADKLCHASLLDGVKLSGAILRIFPHNNLQTLESHLVWARKTHPNARVLVLTESVFSMGGDVAPLKEIIDLKDRFEAMLLLDEAHAVGVVGLNGRGLAAAEALDQRVEIQMGTMSKALGVSGGYICGSRELVEWLINRARSFIFSTAPPPAVAETAAAAVRILQTQAGHERRERLRRNLDLMRKVFAMAHDGAHQSAIFPWIIGDAQEALEAAENLLAKGLLVPAIRYPTVAKGKARLRITVTAAHEGAQISSLGEALRSRSGGLWPPNS